MPATSAPRNDAAVLRDLARKYADAARDPAQEAKRALWRRHNSRKTSDVPVVAQIGMHNVWCREVFGPDTLKCEDPLFRLYERALRMRLFVHETGDDTILEPWLLHRAAIHTHPDGLWGMKETRLSPGLEGGAWKFDPPIRDWSDAGRLIPPIHRIDEEKTRAEKQRLEDAVGDILPVAIERGPLCVGFNSDISTRLVRLRGLEQLMLDMLDAPRELHRLLAFMRDGILANQQQAEDAGDFGLTTGHNQCHTYSEELPDPRPNAFDRKRRELWGYCAAQEFTLISPAMHEEFLLQYQMPIMEKFGLTAYGCCEDLTTKIAMLRKVRNLRIIAVTPRADLRRCVEQIGTDYVISWRPNPTDMVCCGWDEARVRKIIGDGLDAARGCAMHISLKDIETLEGDTGRLRRWVGVVKDEIAKRA